VHHNTATKNGNNGLNHRYAQMSADKDVMTATARILAQESKDFAVSGTEFRDEPAFRGSIQWASDMAGALDEKGLGFLRGKISSKRAKSAGVV
jgi:hypothetical protein